MAKRIVGTGNFTYEVIYPWGELPRGMTLGDVSHVAVDTADHVYVYQKQNPAILVFDTSGHFQSAWNDVPILDAHGICITPQDEIFLVDRDGHEVLKFNTQGEIQLRLGQRDCPAWQAPFNHPADVAVSPSGEIYVADGYGNSAVHQFSPEGVHRRTWGQPGGRPGQFFNPHAVWVDRRHRVYVADQEKNHRVQIFDSEGVYIGEWTDFYTPMDIYGDVDGAIYVTDYIPRITVLNPEGEILSRFRSPVAAHGLWGDSQGNLYCAGNLEGLAKLLRR